MQRNFHFYRWIVLIIYAAETWSLHKAQEKGARIVTWVVLIIYAVRQQRAAHNTTPALDRQFPNLCKKPRSAISAKSITCRFSWTSWVTLYVYTPPVQTGSES